MLLAIQDATLPPLATPEKRTSCLATRSEHRRSAAMISPCGSVYSSVVWYQTSVLKFSLATSFLPPVVLAHVSEFIPTAALSDEPYEVLKSTFLSRQES